ncbi:antitoxin HicB [Candidatus Kuenenbacteria bacterium HGW-Kuenenbacteria-1]|uniref:Antitoxin HicB n=1 Tax=Candidatus Kuenenbacteria bacterium HGW-Kuenenbacteria-1 TaxID=2013812 RepID=A0A2N1UPJ9_9BACT|nr:MAG: antitoxin HicB [Candidatus Kuenenbacteria bacterium HGW-Kuenenbacteria-1]
MKQIEQKFFHYNIIFRAEPEGGFTVIIPSLPGCITYGKDLKEAKIMAIDAIKGYVASLKKHKELIPSDEETFMTTVELEKVFIKKPSLVYA